MAKELNTDQHTIDEQQQMETEEQQTKRIVKDLVPNTTQDAMKDRRN